MDTGTVVSDADVAHLVARFLARNGCERTRSSLQKEAKHLFNGARGPSSNVTLLTRLGGLKDILNLCLVPREKQVDKEGVSFSSSPIAQPVPLPLPQVNVPVSTPQPRSVLCQSLIDMVDECFRGVTITGSKEQQMTVVYTFENILRMVPSFINMAHSSTSNSSVSVSLPLPIPLPIPISPENETIPLPNNSNNKSSDPNSTNRSNSTNANNSNANNNIPIPSNNNEGLETPPPPSKRHRVDTTPSTVVSIPSSTCFNTPPLAERREIGMCMLQSPNPTPKPGREWIGMDSSMKPFLAEREHAHLLSYPSHSVDPFYEKEGGARGVGVQFTASGIEGGGSGKKQSTETHNADSGVHTVNDKLGSPIHTIDILSSPYSASPCVSLGLNFFQDSPASLSMCAPEHSLVGVEQEEQQKIVKTKPKAKAKARIKRGKVVNRAKVGVSDALTLEQKGSKLLQQNPEDLIARLKRAQQKSQSG